MELDAYVESEIVKPYKQIITTQTSLPQAQRIMGSLNLLRPVRQAYEDKVSFNIHRTSHHSVPDPSLDIIKGAEWVLRQRLFAPSKRKDVKIYNENGESKASKSQKLPKNLIDVRKQGRTRVKENYAEMIYKCFPDLRFKILVG